MARPRLVSDEQILSTTKACVEKHGPHVSLDVVAEALGITGPALLKRFGSRQELFLRALVPTSVPAWQQRLASGPDERPLVDQLDELFQGMSQFFAETIPCISALRESGISHKDVQQLHKDPPPVRSIKAIAAWLKAARAKGLVQHEDYDTAATAILGAITHRQWLGHMYKQHWSHQNQRTFNREMAQFFTRALTAPDPSPRGR